MTIERQITPRNPHAVKTGRTGRYLNIHCSLEIAEAAATLKRLAYLTPYYAVATFLVLIAVICLHAHSDTAISPQNISGLPGEASCKLCNNWSW